MVQLFARSRRPALGVPLGGVLGWDRRASQGGMMFGWHVPSGRRVSLSILLDLSRNLPRSARVADRLAAARANAEKTPGSRFSCVPNGFAARVDGEVADARRRRLRRPATH